MCFPVNQENDVSLGVAVADKKYDIFYREKLFKIFRLKTLQYLLPWRRLQDIVEAVEKNELSKEEYPYVRLPPSLGPGDGAGSPTLKKAHSVRTFRYRWPDEPRYPLWSPALPCILCPCTSKIIPVIE